MQKNITAQIMAEFSKNIILQGKKFNVALVQEILVKYSQTELLENKDKKSRIDI